MTDSEEQRPRYDDEISLVDIAATFVRRRRIFYIVFLLITGAGVVYALLTTDQYEYVSLIQVAEKSGGEPLENPATTIATLESRWLPEMQSTYRAENDRPLPVNVTFSNPSDTTLLRLRTETSKSNAQAAEETHASLIEKVKISQDAKIEREKNSLERQIGSLDEVVESLQGQQEVGEAIATAIQKRVSLESELEQLEPVEVLVVSRESAGKKGTNRRLIVVMAMLFGGGVGVFLVFMTEFWSSVRRRVAEEGQDSDCSH